MISQPVSFSDLHLDRRGVVGRNRRYGTDLGNRGIAASVARRLYHGSRLCIPADAVRFGHANRRRLLADVYVDAQSAAGHRAPSAGVALVRIGERQPCICSGPFGALASGSQHLFWIHVGFEDLENGWTELWVEGTPIHLPHPHPGGISEYIDRVENRLGFRLAHADCG